jgi:hypothetical protein
LIESAKLNGLNPQHYIADVLARIADHPARRIAELRPWNWQPLDATRAAAWAGPLAERLQNNRLDRKSPIQVRCELGFSDEARAGVILMQRIPFADIKALAVFAGFEAAVYAALS